jgi:hypothetical protein
MFRQPFAPAIWHILLFGFFLDTFGRLFFFTRWLWHWRSEIIFFTVRYCHDK